ncbi:Uncharacterized protein Fot_18468 [Forsythia ovata]|uniref:Uncharacterized protein n=1 Tax=Forsythia ovata TaxID=205694 RepID=A0ABD1VIB2_9LAMI
MHILYCLKRQRNKSTSRGGAAGVESYGGSWVGGGRGATSWKVFDQGWIGLGVLKNEDEGKVPKAKLPHLCQRPLDQAGCKSRDVHEWQGLEGESQQVNPQDRPP